MRAHQASPRNPPSVSNVPVKKCSVVQRAYVQTNFRMLFHLWGDGRGRRPQGTGDFAAALRDVSTRAGSSHPWAFPLWDWNGHPVSDMPRYQMTLRPLGVLLFLFGRRMCTVHCFGLLSCLSLWNWVCWEKQNRTVFELSLCSRVPWSWRSRAGEGTQQVKGFADRACGPERTNAHRVVLWPAHMCCVPSHTHHECTG